MQVHKSRRDRFHFHDAELCSAMIKTASNVVPVVEVMRVGESIVVARAYEQSVGECLFQGSCCFTGPRQQVEGSEEVLCTRPETELRRNGRERSDDRRMGRSPRCRWFRPLAPAQERAWELRVAIRSTQGLHCDSIGASLAGWKAGAGAGRRWRETEALSRLVAKLDGRGPGRGHPASSASAATPHATWSSPQNSGSFAVCLCSFHLFSGSFQGLFRVELFRQKRL
jgi:hypothetical protein